MPAGSEDAFSVYDEVLRKHPPDRARPWNQDGVFVPNISLLRELLQIPIGASQTQQSGRVAKAFDAWVAHELRRGGFNENAVWPRTRRPRVLPEDLSPLEERLDTLDQRLRDAEESGAALIPTQLRQAIVALRDALPGAADARVLGDFYVKQIDVTVSSWERGPEVLISTKTMFSSFGKNLHNRHEEAVGEVASLRRRHPMAAMGFAFLAHRTIHDEGDSYTALADILRRLRRDGAFDASMLLIGDWDLNQPDAHIRSVEAPADDLSASNFFTHIIDAVIDRTPHGIHPGIRALRAQSDTDGYPGDDEDPETI